MVGRATPSEVGAVKPSRRRRHSQRHDRYVRVLHRFSGDIGEGWLVILECGTDLRNSMDEQVNLGVRQYAPRRLLARTSLPG